MHAPELNRRRSRAQRASQIAGIAAKINTASQCGITHVKAVIGPLDCESRGFYPLNCFSNPTETGWWRNDGEAAATGFAL